MAYVVCSYAFGVLQWSVLWIFTIFCSYYLHTARFGPTKDFAQVTGTIAQLMASWHIGGADPEVGWVWVKLIAVWVFGTVAIQDFRDVPGDLASSRRTMPILLGDIPGK